MAAPNQTTLALAEPQAVSMTPLDMIQRAFESAIERGAGLEVVDRILQQQRDMMEYQDRVAFNGALARVQANARRIKATSENPQTRSKYANFAALDNELRPLYVAEGLALSFNTADIDKPDTVRVVCDVSLGGYSRQYHIDMPADGKGAKGNDVMTKTHATGSAVSYGKRYLLLMIFNLTVGENDDDGNAAGGKGDGMRPDVLKGWIEKMRAAADPGQLAAAYHAAYKIAEGLGDKSAMYDLIACNKAEKGEIQMTLEERINLCKQGGDEWFDLHLARVTASSARDAMDFKRNGEESERRANYKALKVSEILTRLSLHDNYVSRDMERGNEMEPFARAAYEMRTGFDVEEVGFVLHPEMPERCGASPDGLLLKQRGGIEIKVPRASTHIKYLLGGQVPDEYEPQLALNMRCADLEWIDFVSYCPEMPAHLKLFIYRLERDEKRLAEIDAHIVRFNAEVDDIVARLNALAPAETLDAQLKASLEEMAWTVTDDDIRAVDSTWKGSTA